MELTIVVAVVAVVAAMAAPRFTRALHRYRAESAARRIAADLERTAAEARHASARRTVRFDTAANTVRIENVADLKDPTASYRLDLTAEPYQARLLRASFGDDAQLVFDGWGKPDSGGTAIVQAGTFTAAVEIDPQTGKATVR